jgi:hypothetical protein
MFRDIKKTVLAVPKDYSVVYKTCAENLHTQTSAVHGSKQLVAHAIHLIIRDKDQSILYTVGWVDCVV